MYAFHPAIFLAVMVATLTMGGALMTSFLQTSLLDSFTCGPESHVQHDACCAMLCLNRVAMDGSACAGFISTGQSCSLCTLGSGPTHDVYTRLVPLDGQYFYGVCAIQAHC